VVGQQKADMADTLQLRDVDMAIIFLAFYKRGARWHYLANATKPSVCGGNAALFQVTLTTCYGWCLPDTCVY